MNEKDIPEAVAGANQTADGEPLKGILVHQNQDGVPKGTKEEAKAREFRTMADGKVVRRQPLATRHFDSAETGSMHPENGQSIDMVDRARYKVRNRYTFLYGEDLAYKGPVILWLTVDEIKGQEHKLEALEGGSVSTRKDIAPPHVKDNASLDSLKKRLSELLSGADALKAEIWSQEKLMKERARKLEITTASRPPVPKDHPRKREAKTNPPPEQLEEIVPGDPAPNPKRGRGRPRLKLPPTEDNGVDLTAPPPGSVSRPPAG